MELAQRTPAKCVGVELDPALAGQATAAAVAWQLPAASVLFLAGDMLAHDLRGYSVIFLYQLPAALAVLDGCPGACVRVCRTTLPTTVGKEWKRSCDSGLANFDCLIALAALHTSLRQPLFLRAA